MFSFLVVRLQNVGIIIKNIHKDNLTIFEKIALHLKCVEFDEN